MKGDFGADLIMELFSSQTYRIARSWARETTMAHWKSRAAPRHNSLRSQLLRLAAARYFSVGQEPNSTSVVVR